MMIMPIMYRYDQISGYLLKKTLLTGTNEISFGCLRARAHQASSSTLRQLCGHTSDPILMENNGVASEWAFACFQSDQYH